MFFQLFLLFTTLFQTNKYIRKCFLNSTLLWKIMFCQLFQMTHHTRGKVSSAFSCFVGPGKKLPENDLGTKRDVLQQVLQLRFEDERYVRNYPEQAVTNDTVKLVKENWMKVNHKISEYPVIVSDQEIARRILALYDKVEYFTSNEKGGGVQRRRSQRLKRKKRQSLSDIWTYCLTF